MVRFVHFDLETRIGPDQRAILCYFSFLICQHGSAPAALANLFSTLPTTNHWKSISRLS